MLVFASARLGSEGESKRSYSEMFVNIVFCDSNNHFLITSNAPIYLFLYPHPTDTFYDLTQLDIFYSALKIKRRGIPNLSSLIQLLLFEI